MLGASACGSVSDNPCFSGPGSLVPLTNISGGENSLALLSRNGGRDASSDASAVCYRTVRMGPVGVRSAARVAGDDLTRRDRAVRLHHVDEGALLARCQGLGGLEEAIVGSKSRPERV
jgi:hypothetical protein